MKAGIRQSSDGLISRVAEPASLLVTPERAAELQESSREWPSWDLGPRQLCDLELLLNGGFSPLQGFLTRADYEGVCGEMRLASGRLWPIPVVLDVSDDFARSLAAGDTIALRDAEIGRAHV